MVGIGTQDGLAEARKFRARHDIRATTLVWDESYRSWVHFGVRSQPAGILLDAKGAVLKRWNIIRLNEVKALLA